MLYKPSINQPNLSIHLSSIQQPTHSSSHSYIILKIYIKSIHQSVIIPSMDLFIHTSIHLSITVLAVICQFKTINNHINSFHRQLLDVKSNFV